MVLEITTLSGTSWMLTLLGAVGLIMVVKWLIGLWP